ncbi:class I SAM-dependent DNA methyltransferase [Sphingomonas nostoxanthinifaciens]|uniref:class I SAM-dependent DNA methyltransferase n=1 Tax=Sphingomonas nostoxanthinifaciens TaxID=2872652 RepID=UPI001CC1EB38|nr:SAM-dependent methyltransferase [Sphingomonas nostoxanthinifaciens]UAK25704.1 nodulation S family protein [Sphingomonas nostoxanthinifaciens]
MSGSSLNAAYFDGIFAADDDPWDLASSDYEAAKFQHTHDVLADRRYVRAFEIGCAHGVLTGQLVGLCDTLLAVDISSKALAKARQRVGDRPGLTLKRMAFPNDVPNDAPYDLVILSEVAYYWSVADLDRACEWLRASVEAGGRIILVHYTGETDYPHSGDAAVEALWAGLAEDFSVVMAERRDRYRLDLWEKR